MKNIKISFVIALVVFVLTDTVYSKNVEKVLVKKIAINAFNQKIKPKTGREAKIIEMLPNVIENDTAFYIVNFQDGFVIVSAENSTPPILGYGTSKNFDNQNSPPALKYLLNSYKKEIKELRKLNAKPTEEINLKWNEISEGIQLKSGTPIVGPLTSTTWGQGYPYNMYCPAGSPAGCVAVAMAQVLYYWNCRVQGYGQHSYQSDYRTESANFGTANYLWSNMNTGSGDSNNALLIYHCGVSVNMDYGSGASSASTSDVVNALTSYFGFKSQADYKERIWHPFDWKSILRANLNYGWPIIYRGQDDALSPPRSCSCLGY